MNKKSQNGYGSLYLSNVDQGVIEPTPETKSNKKVDDSVKSTIFPSTLMETPQMIIRTKTPLLQNAKQIYKPLAQQETLSLEKSEMLVAPLHLEKSITLLQETFELHFEKISKTAANIECCQNKNTTTLQQNIANLKSELFSKDEMIKLI